MRAPFQNVQSLGSRKVYILQSVVHYPRRSNTQSCPALMGFTLWSFSMPCRDVFVMDSVKQAEQVGARVVQTMTNS